MNQKIKLLPDQSKALTLLPEHGMGYQFVDIEFNDGRQLKKVTVIDSTFFMVEENLVVDPKDILSIKLHK